MYDDDDNDDDGWLAVRQGIRRSRAIENDFDYLNTLFTLDVSCSSFSESGISFPLSIVYSHN